MAFNGSGVYVLYSPGNPVVTGTTISSTWANNTLSDIATGLSTCVTKDAQTTTTGVIPFILGISTFGVNLHGITGSSQIGYTGTGTGIVATTVQARLRQLYSVKDYGATGDGVTDDTAAIQLAATAAAGKTLWFPDGTYMTTGKTNVAGNILLSEGTTVKLSSSFGATAIFLVTGDNWVIEGGTLDCDYKAISRGVRFDSGENCEVRNMRIVDAVLGGVDIGSDVINLSIQNNTFVGAGYNILYDDAANAQADSGSYGLIISGNMFIGDPNNVGSIDGDHIEINAPDNGYHSFLIQDNLFFDAWASDTTAGFHVGLSGVYDGVVCDNYMERSSHNAIHLEEGGRGTATGAFEESYNIDIRGNQIIDAGTINATKQSGIQVTYSRCNVTENTVIGSGLNGIYVTGYSAKGTPATTTMTGTQVCRNTVRDSQQHGISVLSLLSSTVADNLCAKNSQQTNDTYSGISANTDSGSVACDYCIFKDNRVIVATVSPVEKYSMQILNTTDSIVRNNVMQDGATSDWVSTGSTGLVQSQNYPNTNFGGPGIDYFSNEMTAGAGLNVASGQIIYSANVGRIYFGSGTPEGAVTATVGSIYLRNNGGVGSSFYVKETGSGNTGWAAK